jgi:hypothetical protein
MGWEQRRNGRYYYRKVRVGRICRSEYVGQGYVAELAASLDKRVRQAAIAKSSARRRAEQQERKVDQALNDYRQLVQAVVGAHLLVAGFHQHKRQWRRQRTTDGQETSD